MNPADLAQLLDTLAQAVRLLPTLQSQPQVQAALAVQPRASAPAAAAGRTLNDWLDVFEAHLATRGYKPQTIKNRKSALKHCRRLWGARPLVAIKPHELASGLKSFGPEGTHAACRVLSEMRDVFAEAVAEGWTERNPARDLKPPRHKVKRARLTFATWQAMRTLAKTGPQRWVESLLLLAVVTGQRRADLAKMRFDDVVTEPDGVRVLRVQQQKEAGKGYGARVSIPLELRLDAIGMTVGEVIEHCRGSAKPGPTLLRKHGGGPIEESSLSARFHEHVVAVLGPQAHRTFEWPSLHETRSLAARLYHEQGEDVQTLLGHKHAEMTAIYTDDRGLSKDEWKRVRPGGRAARSATERTA